MNPEVKNYYKNLASTYATLWNVTNTGTVITILTSVMISIFFGEIWRQLNRFFVILAVIWFVLNMIGTIVSISKRIVFKYESIFTLLQTSLLTFLMLYIIFFFLMINGVQADKITIKISTIHAIMLIFCIVLSSVISIVYNGKEIVRRIKKSKNISKFTRVSFFTILPFVFIGTFLARTNQETGSFLIIVSYILALISPYAIKDYYFLTYLKFKSKEYWENEDYRRIQPIRTTILNNIKRKFVLNKYIRYGLVCLFLLILLPYLNIFLVDKFGVKDLVHLFRWSWIITLILMVYFFYRHFKAYKEISNETKRKNTRTK